MASDSQRRSTRGRRFLVAGGLAVGIMTVAGVTFATGGIPSPTGEIHACYAKHSGKLRVVTGPNKCRKTERSLKWNQRGPAGIAARETQEGSERIAPPSNPNQSPSGFSSATVTCPAGKEVLGGGFRLGGGIDDLGENLRVLSSSPSGANGWRVSVRNESTTKPHLFRAVAICARVD